MLFIAVGRAGAFNNRHLVFIDKSDNIRFIHIHQRPYYRQIHSVQRGYRAEGMDCLLYTSNSGTILSNSGTSLPDALSEQQADSDKKSEYLYYLSLQYDSAGNISNCLLYTSRCV